MSLGMSSGTSATRLSPGIVSLGMLTSITHIPAFHLISTPKGLLPFGKSLATLGSCTTNRIPDEAGCNLVLRFMISIKKIVVPVDFSEPSKKAVTYGLSLAEQFRAKLILAHIVPESTALLYAFPTELPDVDKDQYEKAKQEINRLVPADRASKLNVRTIVKVGKIEEELLGIVRDEAIDLVVMGTHGRRYPGRWFIGSVTEHMLRKVPVPTLTVSHVEPEEHAIGVVSLKRVLYATDLPESSNVGFQHAIELARRWGAQPTVLHVIDDSDRILWGPALMAYLDRAKLAEEWGNRLDELITREKSPD